MLAAEQPIDGARSTVRQMIKAAKYPQARIAATQLLKKYGQDAELLYLRGRATSHRASSEQAEKDLKAAIALRPKQIEYHLALSSTLFKNGKYEASWNQFLYASLLNPNDARVKAYAKNLIEPEGKIHKTIQHYEESLHRNHLNRSLVGQLVTLYFICAVFHWNKRYQNKQIAFYATSSIQIEEAESYLKKINGLRFLNETASRKKYQLIEVIKNSKKREYNGFYGDWITIGITIGLAVILNNFFGYLYAISAIGSLWAFLQPNYFSNRGPIKYMQNINGYTHYFLDGVYGDYFSPKMRIFENLKYQTYRVEAAKWLRAIVRLVAFPVATFAGLYKNYAVKYAAAFSLMTISLSMMLSL